VTCPVEFLGVVGLDVLIAGSRAAQAHGAELRVVTGSRLVRRLLALSGLDRVLDTVPRLVEVTPPVPRQAGH
jgi:anti-anti-sigma factor